MALLGPKRALECNTVNPGSELGLRCVVIIRFDYIKLTQAQIGVELKALSGQHLTGVYAFINPPGMKN